MVCQSTSALSHPPYHLTWPWAGLPWRLVSQQWGTTSKSKYCTHFHLSATASLTASNNLPLSLSWQDTWTKCTFQHRRGLFHTSHNKQYCVGTFAAQSIDFSNFPSLPLTSNINEDPGILNIKVTSSLHSMDSMAFVMYICFISFPFLLKQAPRTWNEVINSAMLSICDLKIGLVTTPGNSLSWNFVSILMGKSHESSHS